MWPHTSADGHYSEDDNYFASKGVDNPPLHALTNGVSGGNGVYAYGASSAFPNQTWNAANYWVDVVFSPSTALPAPWQTVDIGNVGLPGSAYPSGSLWSVTGAGSLSGTADAFRFLYQPMSADGEIRAQLSSVPNTSTNARVGVIIRETLTPGSQVRLYGHFPGRHLPLAESQQHFGQHRFDGLQRLRAAQRLGPPGAHRQ